jgi:serine/threonine protein kinase
MTGSSSLLSSSITYSPMNTSTTSALTSSRTMTPDEEYIPATNGRRLGLTLDDFKLVQTIGTGTFGRVYICKSTRDQKESFFAMKMLKKVEVVRLKQVEHINSEKQILSEVRFPFIVNL